MTTVFFVRHAESDTTITDDRVRPLTSKGMDDRHLVTAFLQDKGIHRVISSPYKRAVDTVADFASTGVFDIETDEEFRERKTGQWLSDGGFHDFARQQWVDFSYKLPDGESLGEVQARNIAALERVLSQNIGKNVVIGTHGTALSTIINYYDRSFGYDSFREIINIMPWVVQMDFNEHGCMGMRMYDLLQPTGDFNL